MLDGHPNWCAEVPHPLVAVYLYWCPANQEWVLSITGGTTDEPLERPVLRFGPFDCEYDVAAEIRRSLGEAALRSLSANS